MSQKHCPCCKTDYSDEYCPTCMRYLRRQIERHPASAMLGTDRIDEVRRWRPCHKRLPVAPKLWAQRMSEVLGRDVSPGEWQRISELGGEVYGKNPPPP